MTMKATIQNGRNFQELELQRGHEFGWQWVNLATGSRGILHNEYFAATKSMWNDLRGTGRLLRVIPDNDSSIEDFCPIHGPEAEHTAVYDFGRESAHVYKYSCGCCVVADVDRDEVEWFANYSVAAGKAGLLVARDKRDEAAISSRG